MQQIPVGHFSRVASNLFQNLLQLTNIITLSYAATPDLQGMSSQLGEMISYNFLLNYKLAFDLKRLKILKSHTVITILFLILWRKTVTQVPITEYTCND